MYRSNRCKSANRLVALFDAASFHPRLSHTDAAGIKKFASVAKRKMLPPELSRNVVKLQCESSADGGVCEVHLVGTGAYADSWGQVEGVVQFLKPHVVFLETCPSCDHRPTGQKVKDDMRVVRIVVRLMNNLYPAFTETFIHECDQYMSGKLLEVAGDHNTVVAVVDMAHLQGIQKHWKEPVDMKQLHKLPMARNASNMILRWWFEKN